MKTADKPLKVKAPTFGVSLKEMLKQDETEPAASLKNDLPKDDFTLNQVQNLWEELLKKLESSDKNFILGAIRNTDIQVHKSGEITMVFHSNASKAEFEKIKIDWFAELEKQLNNFHIQYHLKVEVTESNQPRIRTPEDIYQNMVTKNPLLEKMRKDFGLDFYS